MEGYYVDNFMWQKLYLRKYFFNLKMQIENRGKPRYYDFVPPKYT